MVSNCSLSVYVYIGHICVYHIIYICMRVSISYIIYIEREKESESGETEEGERENPTESTTNGVLIVSQTLHCALRFGKEVKSTTDSSSWNRDFSFGKPEER